MGILDSLRRRPGDPASDPVLEASNADLDAAIAEFSRKNRDRRDPGLERRILRARHRRGVALVDQAGESASWPDPDESLSGGRPLPEASLEELTPARLRAGILRDGWVLVRGAVARDEALALADGIEAALRERGNGARSQSGLYEEFDPDPPYTLDERDWVVGGGGLWGADSPRLSFSMFETYRRAGLPGLIEGYLGEPPVISVNKCTLRKVEPDAGRGWHQDGAFMGGVRALNVWLSLSRCGDRAPGMDIVPRRLDRIVPTGTAGAAFDWSVSEAVALEAAGDRAIVRPTFEPGDMLLFDEMLLHTTAAEPEMKAPRFAIETWFFSPSKFPGDYVPVSV
jgi:hypothetical protein